MSLLLDVGRAERIRGERSKRGGRRPVNECSARDELGGKGVRMRVVNTPPVHAAHVRNDAAVSEGGDVGLE